MPLSYRPRLAPPPAFAPAVLALCAVKLALPFFIPAAWGFQRDELLYFAMGDHLEPLRMQFPPFIAMAARLLDALTGTTVLGTRLAAALAGAAYLLLAALVARDLGGGTRAQLLAGLGVLVAPVFLRAGVLFQPVVFEQVWWLLACWALLRLLRDDGPGWWLVLGAALGLAALTKFSALFIGIGVAVAVLLSPRRADLRTRWPWLALGLAVLLGLPSLTGQAAWGWPFLAQARVLREAQLDRVSPLAFLAEQPLLLAAALPLALTGLVALLAGGPLPEGRARPLAWLALTVTALFLAFGGKAYYLAPVHGALVAAGAVALDRWLRGRLAIPLGLYGAAMVVAGFLLLPVGVPVLPPHDMIGYASRLGVAEATTTNTGTRLALPQDYADMLGWEELAAAVAEVWRTLPAEEQARAAIVAVNYGRAGALQHYGPRHGLPAPISLSGDFWAWGPGDRPGDVLVVVGGDEARLRALFGEILLVRTVENPLGVEEERAVPIWIVRQPAKDLRTLWRELGPQWG